MQNVHPGQPPAAGGLAWLSASVYAAGMSTALEIEAIMEHLPDAERAKLRDRLLACTATSAKSGAELAALWPTSFHLTKQEADDFARDLASAPQAPATSLAWE